MKNKIRMSAAPSELQTAVRTYCTSSIPHFDSIGTRLFGVLLLLAGFMLLCSPAHAIVMGGVIGWSYQWPSKQDGYNRLLAPIQINQAGGNGGPGSNYDLAINWGFAHENGGYIGLQNRNGPHWGNFSIWGATTWSNVNSSANCRPFSHEGSGVQCDMPYDWQEGARYTLEVVDIGNRQWEGSIRNDNTGVRTVIVPVFMRTQAGEGFLPVSAGLLKSIRKARDN